MQQKKRQKRLQNTRFNLKLTIMKRITTFKTISGYEIKVSANHSKRHFTIKTDAGKFRTTPMTKEEFTSCLNNTGNDWMQFLRACGDYYKV